MNNTIEITVNDFVVTPLTNYDSISNQNSNDIFRDTQQRNKTWREREQDFYVKQRLKDIKETEKYLEEDSPKETSSNTYNKMFS